MEEGNQSREFTPEMKLFVVLEKEKGTTYPRLVEMFGQKWPDKKPLPASLEELKATIKREFRAIPEVMVKKAVYGMKKRAAKMVEVEGRAFEGKSIRL